MVVCVVVCAVVRVVVRAVVRLGTWGGLYDFYDFDSMQSESVTMCAVDHNWKSGHFYACTYCMLVYVILIWLLM